MRVVLIMIGIGALAAAAAFGADAAAGKAAYDTSCKKCHGVDGAPVASVQKMLKADNMKDLKDPSVQAETPAQMKEIILNGKGKMKPVKTIAAGDVDNVIAYVKSMKK